MSLIDTIAKHAEPERTRVLEIPEWAVDGAPLRIYYRMVTLDDMALVTELDGSAWHKQAARFVTLKAEDEKGNKLFKAADAAMLRERAAPDVVNRIALAMLGRLSIEDAEKN